MAVGRIASARYETEEEAKKRRRGWIRRRWRVANSWFFDLAWCGIAAKVAKLAGKCDQSGQSRQNSKACFAADGNGVSKCLTKRTPSFS